MKKFFKLLSGHILLTLIATSTTVVKSGYVFRSSVDENTPLYNSDMVEGRGWLDQFIADDPFKPNFGSIGIKDRFLLNSFLFDFTVFFVLLIPVTLILRIAANRFGKTRKSEIT